MGDIYCCIVYHGEKVEWGTAVPQHTVPSEREGGTKGAGGERSSCRTAESRIPTFLGKKPHANQIHMF